MDWAVSRQKALSVSSSRNAPSVKTWRWEVGRKAADSSTGGRKSSCQWNVLHCSLREKCGKEEGWSQCFSAGAKLAFKAEFPRTAGMLVQALVCKCITQKGRKPALQWDWNVRPGLLWVYLKIRILRLLKTSSMEDLKGLPLRGFPAGFSITLAFPMAAGFGAKVVLAVT